MRKTSPAVRRWQEVDAHIQFFPEGELRQFFAAAAKFLVDSRFWDDPPPRTVFDDKEEVQSFHRGFEQFSRARMLARSGAADAVDDELLEVLKKAAEWNYKTLHRRVATRRLQKLRRRLQKRLGRFGGTERPFRGLRFYERVIRQKYLRDAPATDTESSAPRTATTSPQPNL